MQDDVVYLLKKRAEIRRQIPSRKSVQEGKPDRIADLLERAASEIEELRMKINALEVLHGGMPVSYSGGPSSSLGEGSNK